MLPAAQEYGLGVIPWSPLQGGLLGGVVRKEDEGVRRLEGRAKESTRKAPPADRAVRGPSRTSSATSPVSSRWPGCCTSRP